MAASIVECFKNPAIVEEAKRTFKEELGGVEYRPLLPPDQKPPVELNRAMMEKFRPLMAAALCQGEAGFQVTDVATLSLECTTNARSTQAPGNSRIGTLWNIGRRATYSGLMLAARITLAHFSVSSAMSLPKSAGEPITMSLFRSARRALTKGSASASFTA